MPAVATVAGLPSRLGKYELLMPLAAGGMARIYIGRSTGIGSFERHVVLKMITPERANDQIAVNMFLDEARLAASLNHQNVAQVFEVGEEQGIHYLAMEYVHGQDMRAVLAKAGSQGTRIPLELALTVVAGAAAGLNHAHERRGADGIPLGIVHRDVSPSNIMIGYDGAVKLLDFGIAKATSRSVETQSGIIKGKFAYMAPEQCRGRDVDRRSDVFSLGIILYEVSTQHRCFRADSDFDTMHRIVTGDVVRPTRLVQGYPQALEAIVMKALAIDASQRYQSAGALLEALESFAVASRMSLSTMGLGRFMRDMFGDMHEPWLNTAATKVMQPMTPPKESTISSTNGQRPSEPSLQANLPNPHAPEHLDDDDDGIPDEDAAFPDSSGVAAKTILELPRSKSQEHEAQNPEWNAKSYPPQQSTPMFSPLPLPPHPMTPPGGHQLPLPAEPLRIPTPPPGTLRRDSTPMPAAFATPSSGTGPAMPAHPPIVSTKHGYASGRGDTSHPHYDAPPDAMLQDMQLKPNRRPLFIGLGLAIVGIIVILVVSLGASKEEDQALPPDDEGSGSATEPESTVMPSTPLPPQPQPQPQPIDDAMVSVVIDSEPSGADVLIAGSKIGTTPLEKKFKRGTKTQELTLRLAGHEEFTAKIDLAKDYENRKIKLAAIGEGSGSDDEEEATPPPVTTPPKTTTPKTTPPKTTTPKTTTPKSTTPKTTTPKTTTPPKITTPKCQPPGPNVDPFSGVPICKT